MVVESIHWHISLTCISDRYRWAKMSSMVWLGLLMMLTFLLVEANSYDICRWHGIIWNNWATSVGRLVYGGIYCRNV